MSIIGFILMGADKHLSRKKGARRIPEKVLFGVAAACGSIGVLTGMYSFRHKTEHPSFRLGIPAILVLQLTAAALFIYNRYLVQ